MIAAAILRWARARQPDFVIGGHDAPYLRRHFLIPRNPVFNVYVHEFLRSDDDRALHDHPWAFNCSVLLEGVYREHTKHGVSLRFAGDIAFRWGRAAHRIELLRAVWGCGDKAVAFGDPLKCWTLFVTGPRVRSWGFYCPKGWVHWRDFTSRDDNGSIGKGCDQ
jgi:hypothetical protein